MNWLTAAAIIIATVGAVSIWTFAKWRDDVERKRQAKIDAVRRRARSPAMMHIDEGSRTREPQGAAD